MLTANTFVASTQNGPLGSARTRRRDVPDISSACPGRDMYPNCLYAIETLSPVLARTRTTQIKIHTYKRDEIQSSRLVCLRITYSTRVPDPRGPPCVAGSAGAVVTPLVMV